MTSQNLKRNGIFIAATLGFVGAAAQAQENFDQAGASWGATMFPNEITVGGGTFSREPLVAATGAPSTTPALPINVDGDKEGRYFEDGLAPVAGYSLSSTNNPNETISGYIGIGFVENFGSRSGGFVLRATVNDNVDAYLASIDHGGGGTATLRIARIRSGIIAGPDILFTSIPFNFRPDNENYHLSFTANAAELSVELFRTVESGGAIVDIPIDILPAAGTQNSTSVMDTELTTGRAGVRAFARGDNSIFWDDIRVEEASSGGCDIGVDFETQALGTLYGTPVPHAPGEVVFTQDNIDVSVHTFFFGGGGSAFNFARIDPAFGGFGDARVAMVNNINFGFDFTNLPAPTAAVEFEYADLGGFENLQVNGFPRYIGELSAAPAVIAPGVSVNFIPGPVGGGTIVLTGDVRTLRVGGQEFFLDNVCVRLAEPDPCDAEVDLETQAIGTVYGDPVGDLPNDVVFNEDGIDVSVHTFFFFGGGSTFNFARIDPTFNGMGDSHIINTNNINLGFDLRPFGCVREVEFEFMDLGGNENMLVNGAPMFNGEIANLPMNIAPGVLASVQTFPVPGGIRGWVRLRGDVDFFLVGGQEFWIDNVCVRTDDRCPCDWNGDCRLNSDDLFEFLNDFFAGDADFNGNGVTNSDDFFEFLNCFFGGC